MMKFVATLARFKYFILAFLVILAFGLRFFWLDQAPRGVLVDEAHFGYISYSLLETSRDEHGIKYPLVFKGFGDQKMPVYAYVLMPMVKVLGLNTMAIRLPSVVAGTLLVLVIYWLLKTLNFSEELSLFGSLIVAISPWSFFLSRFAYESNLGLLLFSLGLVFLVKTSKDEQWFWPVLWAISWAATWYSYVAFRPVTTLLAITYLGYLFFNKQIKAKTALIFALVFGILISPLFQPSVAATGASRFRQVGLLNDQGVVRQINEDRTYCSSHLPRTICYMVWNKPTVITKTLAQRFFDVYSPEFLSTRGDLGNRYLSVENYGQFFMVLYPLLILGILMVFFKVEDLKLSNSTRVLIVLGLLIAPIPAILAGEPQKVRLSALMPFLITAQVMGLAVLFSFIENLRWRKLLSLVLVAILAVNSAAYFLSYFTIHTTKHDLVYQSYLPDLFKFAADWGEPETKIVIKPFVSDPLMAYAYYQQIDPQYYQENVVLGELEESGFQHAVGLGRLQVSDEPFVNIACHAAAESQPTIYITNENFREISSLYSATSETGAVYYAFIYDALTYGQAHPESCFD